MKFITNIYESLRKDRVEISNTNHTLRVGNAQLNFTKAGWLVGLKINVDTIECKKVSYNDNRLRFKLDNGLFYVKCLDKKNQVNV